MNQDLQTKPKVRTFIPPNRAGREETFQHWHNELKRMLYNQKPNQNETRI